MGGPESFVPSEGEGGASEGLSEAARAKFAGAQAAMQQIRREEKKAKKRDDGVAGVILQFLTDTQKAHLATLISRLVAIDCPSTFILAILSLINEDCRTAVEDYLKEQQIERLPVNAAANMIPAQSALDDAANHRLVMWIEQMETVLATDSTNILNALLVEHRNIDGTVLQLTTFVLKEFLESHDKHPSFESLQGLSISVLQSLFEPHLAAHTLEETNAPDED